MHSLDGESLASPQHRPSDPCQLVGEGDDRNIVMGAVLKSPFAHRPSGVSRVSYVGGKAASAPWTRSLRRYLLPRLLIPEQLRLAAGGELLWDQGRARRRDPADEAFRPAEQRPPALRRSLARRQESLSADEPHRSLSPSGRTSSFKGCNPLIELSPLRAGVRDAAELCVGSVPRRPAHPSCMLRKCSSFRLPCGASMPTLQQDGAQLIDQSRPFADQPVSRSMERLHVELILTFHVDEPHRRTGGLLRRSLQRRDRRSSAT